MTKKNSSSSRGWNRSRNYGSWFSGSGSSGFKTGSDYEIDRCPFGGGGIDAAGASLTPDETPQGM